MPPGNANLAIMLLRQVGHEDVVLLARCYFLFRGKMMVCDPVVTDRNSGSPAWLQHPIVRN